jgi:hypothetical protein
METGPRDPVAMWFPDDFQHLDALAERITRWVVRQTRRIVI